jgi:hypothetical protein
MKIGPRLSRLALTLALGLGTSLGALAADPSQFSEAEKLVFTDPQLANVKAPTSLHYSFVKSGTLEPGFQDEVHIDVDSGRKVQGRFLSGPRAVVLPAIEQAEANPVILFFLERDIRDMERLTKGKSAYFRKRIRMAMVDAATVRDTRVQFNGAEVPAREVTLQPYAKDPMRPRFERYADKRYTFVLAKDVPGGVYQLRTSLPGALPSDAPVMEEVLTLTGAGGGKAASASSSNPSATPR